MQACILSSGSEGNCTYISTKNHKILLDMGTNAKYIKDHLELIDVNADDIDYVFITHTHKDHVSALPVFIKKYKPTVCISAKMFSELECLKDYDNILLFDNKVELDDNTIIDIIKTSHDAEDSRSFIITNDDKKIVYLTDTGYINQKYFDKLSNCELYLFESNHDVEMLINGPYPKMLKDRILGPKGHLSNKDSSVYLAKLIGDKTKKIVLTHLSSHNNTDELALSTIKETFKEYDIRFKNISCAHQKEMGEIIKV